MKLQRLYETPDGESHWEDVEIDLQERSFAPPAAAMLASAAEPVARTLFLRLPAGWDEPAHPAPAVQRMVCLSGVLRVTASDGDVRDITRGDVWHMEDTGGKGHHAAVVGDSDFEAVVIQFA